MIRRKIVSWSYLPLYQQVREELFSLGLKIFGISLVFALAPLTFLRSQSQDLQNIPTGDPRRLLRVWPSYRPEECDWAIRKFICLRCLKNGHRYAQEIHFLEEGRPYRIHGCFTSDEKFFPIQEGRDHKTDF